MTDGRTQILVGSSHRRIDAADKIAGRTLFCSDALPPGCLHMGALHPPIARGRVRRLDVSAARSAPGVHAVLLHSDLPAAKRMGMIVDDQPVIVEEEFFCASDVLAIVAAETQEQVRRALRLISLEVDPLPGVYDVTEALREGAPLATDSSGNTNNVQALYKVRAGDARSALSDAAVVVETVTTTHHIDHAFLEPEAGLAWFEADGTLIVRGSMQAPFVTRGKVAAVLGLPASRVRVQVPAVGGGFGGKEESGLKIGAWTSLLAKATGRPVCYQRSRGESMRANGKREPSLIRHRLGASKEGELVGMEAEILLDKGAYASLGGSPKFVSGTLKKATLHAAGPYRMRNVHIDAKSVFTSNVPTCPMRGLGVPQVHFALETQIDALACALNIDPIDLRLRNCLRNGDTTFAGQCLDQSVGIAECLEAVAGISSWKSTPRSSGDGRKRRGRGVAAGWYATGTAFNRDAAGAVVYLAEDGSVSIGVNIVEMGQGALTVFSQLAAEALGADPDTVQMLPVDTFLAPNAGITAGSRSTTVPGKAVVSAAKELRGRLETIAAEMLGVSESDLIAAGGRFFTRDQANRFISFKEIAQAAVPQGIPLYAQGWEAAPTLHVDLETGLGMPFAVFAYGAQVIDVEVDVDTGRTRVLEAYAAHDVGRAVNPAAIEGQIEGGMVMAIGQALYEELDFSEGVPVNPNFTDYLLPTSMEAPPRMAVAIVESRYERGPYGAKGVGEMSLVPTMAAVANAIHAAVGVRVREMPATAPRLLAALRGVH